MKANTMQEVVNLDFSKVELMVVGQEREIDCLMAGRSRPLTPCEKEGYGVGDKFLVIDGESEYHSKFKVNQIVTLHEDDATNVPIFQNEEMDTIDYLHLDSVKPTKDGK